MPLLQLVGEGAETFIVGGLGCLASVRAALARWCVFEAGREVTRPPRELAGLRTEVARGH
ncbi:hypothetical protein OK17_18215 [Gordonia sp. GN26]